MEIFALHVYTGKEREFVREQQHLTKEHTKGGEFYIPIREIEIRRGGKLIPEAKPVFPGYVFWVCESWNTDLLWLWRQSTCFVRVLGPGRKPLALCGKDFEIITHLMGFGETLGISSVIFDENSRIIVANGPLKGLEGRIVSVDKRKKRARVRLDLYKSTFEIDFGFELLETTGKPVG